MDKTILKKACSYCVYQERTHAEVRKRLSEWKVFGDEAEEIISWLIIENFLNEERFAKAFAGGKFRLKNWGKRKITFELKGRKISAYCIKEALNEIKDDEYESTIIKLIKKKEKEYGKEKTTHQKIYNYLIGKGSEPENFVKHLSF